MSGHSRSSPAFAIGGTDDLAHVVEKRVIERLEREILRAVELAVARAHERRQRQRLG